MGKSELISIIVPVYNAEQYLTECLDSLIQQTYKAVEIILVNDGSTDKSGEICKSYITRHANIHYFEQNNQGQNAARLKGLSYATGSWIFLVDADDFISRDMCKVFMSEQRKSGADIVIGGKQKVFDKEIIKEREQGVHFGSQKGMEVAYQFLNDYGRIISPLALWSILFRKRDITVALESIDLGITFCEDCACVLHVLTMVKKAHWINEELYYYRISQTSFTQQHNNNILVGQKKLLLHWDKIFREREDLHHIKVLCDKFVIRNLMLGGYEWFNDFPGIYPFAKIDEGKTVALYGAGILGEEIREKVSGKYTITNVYDKAYMNYQKMGRDVKNPEELITDMCDYVLVAIWNKKVANNVAEDLRKSFKGKVILTVDDAILDSGYTCKKIEELRHIS